MLRSSLGFVLGAALGYAVASARSAGKAKKAPAACGRIPKAQRLHTILLALPLPDSEEAVRTNKALIQKAALRTDCRMYIVFGSGQEEKIGTEVLAAALRHYDDFWEAVVADSRLDVDCKVLLPGPTSATALQAVWRDGQLEAVFGQETELLERIVGDVNKFRSMAGLEAVTFVSLENIARKAHVDHHLYFDDIRGRTPRFRNVVLGGTFDRFHVGHRKLLSVAMMIAKERLVVGITSDAMLTKKANASMIQSFDERAATVRAFVMALRPGLPVEVVAISDVYGPTVTDPLLDAIVVSSETASGGDKINEERIKRGMRSLAVVVLQRTSSVSSSFIRNALAAGER